MTKAAQARNTPVHRAPREVNSGDTAIQQKSPIADHKNHKGDVIIASPVIDKDYVDELAFNEEPVTIRLSQSAEKFAPKHFPVWVNGKGAEVLHNGRWIEMAYLPVGANITIKRKYLAVIAAAKHDTIRTVVAGRDTDTPENLIDRSTSAAAAFSVIQDKNPLGAAWLSELLHRAG